MPKSASSGGKGCGRLVKALVFRSALGLTEQSAEFIKNAILEAIPGSKAIPGREDQYGKRYTVDVKIRNLDKEVVIRTAWIIKNGEEFPHLTTCYVT